MPLLNLFYKKSKSPLKASTANLSTSNVSSGDNEWVSVNTAAAVTSAGEQQRAQRQRQPSSSSNDPTRVSNDDSIYDPPIRHSSLFPLQGDKPGVFRSTQSLPGHSDPGTRPASHKLSSSPPPLPVFSKKSFFNWVSSKERSHITSSVKSTSDSGDQSFNLKSFRHVRPESPSFNYTNTPSSAAAAVSPRPPSPITPTLVPVPTSTLPPPSVSFQVTSRRPRPSPVSPLSLDISSTSPGLSSQSSSPQDTPQPRIVAGAFRQAARRSATSLTLGDPVVSPGTGLEDTGTGTGTGLGPLFFENDIAKTASFLSSSPPKLSLLSFSNSTTDVSTIFNNISVSRPPRSQPPPNLSNHHPSSSNSYTQLNHSSASIPAPASTITLNSPVLPATPISGPKSIVTSTKPTPSSSKSFPTRPLKPNYVDSSSSEDSDSEESESESGSDGSDSGIPRVSRKRTVRPRNITANTATTTSSTTNSAAVALGRPRAATTASASSRPGTIVLEASSSKADMLSANPSLERFSASTPVDGPTVSRPPSTLDVHPNGGVRSRASASVGAIHPSAKEARASAILANSRLSTATNLSTPKAMAKPLSRSAGSDTSESSESESDSQKDSDEDAPLSKLVPPKRPGTSMSSYSTNSNSSLRTKPLIDLSAPNTFSGRPVGAPAPISREEEELPKPRILVDTAGRSSPNLKNSSPVIKVVPLPQSQSSSQQQPGQRPPRVPLSSTSSMSSPSSSGASLTTSSRGVAGASSDTSTSPIDRYSKYHSFANGAANLTSDNNGPIKPAVGNLSTKSSPSGSPALPSTLPPMRPFLRRESPATSSTGDSSSGKVPLTPKDGNDIRQRSQTPSSALVSSKDRHQRPTHGRKPSVTFEDEVPLADKGVKSGGNSHLKLKEGDLEAEEAKRRERRRGEARAAIELGKVVNGPPPVDDEVELGASGQAMWPQFGMQMPMQPMQVPMPMPMQPMFATGGGVGIGGGMGGMGMQPQLPMAFPSSVPNNDPTFLAAHQQAMSIAKQAYQYAVAQQALAAANDEWERSSTMTGFMPVNGMPVNGYMNMNMRGSVMFPPAPVSMYAGNTGGGGSLINGFGGLGGGAGAWGETRSVYGGSFGPTTPMGMRAPTYSSTDLTAFNPAMGAGAGASVVNYGVGGPTQGRLVQQRPGVRQRTRTAPSSPVPPSHGSVPPLPSPSKSAIRTRAPAPPSSFRGVPNQ